MFRTNKNNPLILNSEIVEWDIKSGNTSIMKYYNLLPDKDIDKLANLSKEKRVIKVGIMQKDPDFASKLERGFNDAVNLFIELNKIPEDNIISIKRDAIFVKNYSIKYNSLDNIVNFVAKNKYKHFLLIPQYEFYIGKSFDVKGLPDDKIKLHDNGMNRFIRDITTIGNNGYSVNKYLKEYLQAYKNKDLILDHYREYNSDSQYRLMIEEYSTIIDEITEDDLNDLDISFNYKNIVLPLTKLFLK